MEATTIAEVIDQLSTIIEQAEATNNRAGYFAALYKKVTMAVAQKIKLGYFDDNARMERLDVVFANRYLQAHQDYLQQKPCSLSWKLALIPATTGGQW